PSATAPSATAPSAATPPVRRSMAEAVATVAASSPSVSWRPTPRSARFAAAIGRRANSRSDRPGGTAVALAEPAPATGATLPDMTDGSASPATAPLRRVIGSALPSSVDVIGTAAPHAARIAPLRRMVGYAHSVRPATRAGAAAPRVPATGLLPNALDRESDGPFTSRSARPTSTGPRRIARTPAPAQAPARSALTAVQHATSASTPAVTATTTATTATTPTAAGASGTVLPLRRHLAVPPQPTGNQPLSGPAADPHQTATGQRAVTAAATVEPRGVALSSVRSLRASRTAVSELRPSTTTGRLAPAPSAYSPRLSALPGRASTGSDD